MPMSGKSAFVAEVRERANTQLPSLPYLGFAFWFAWNLVAFSGSIWLRQDDSSSYIMYLFTAHLLASVCTLLAVNAIMPRRSSLVLSTRFLGLGAGLGSVGTGLMILEGGGEGGSIALFVVGCALAGAGTSFMLVRSGMVLGLVSPRRSFKNISLGALFAIAVYFFIEGYSSLVGSVLFVALPPLSALCLAIRIDLPAERAIMCAQSALPRRFGSLLLAIFVYSLSQAVTKGYLLANLPAAQWVLCMRYVMLALVALMIVFIVINLLMAANTSFGRIFYPLAIAFVLPQLAIPFLSEYALVAAVGIDFAGYGFDLFVWAMAAYLAFQMKSNSVKVFCFCTASLSAGLALGNGVALVLSVLQPTTMQFYTLNCLLAVASLVVTVFVFPDSRLHDLLKPVDDDLCDDAQRLVRHQREEKRRAFKEACQSVAHDGLLSKRETEVLLMLAKGNTAQQIADDLYISVHTARAHIRNIHSKLEVASRKEIMEKIEEEIRKQS